MRLSAISYNIRRRNSQHLCADNSGGNHVSGNYNSFNFCSAVKGRTGELSSHVF